MFVACPRRYAAGSVLDHWRGPRCAQPMVPRITSRLRADTLQPRGRCPSWAEVSAMDAAGSASRSVSALVRRRGRMGWVRLTASMLAVAVLLVSAAPTRAAPGGTPSEAVGIAGDGRFSGQVGPQSARWYRFSYRGNTPL